jgi:hypothetical protein
MKWHDICLLDDDYVWHIVTFAILFVFFLCSSITECFSLGTSVTKIDIVYSEAK